MPERTDAELVRIAAEKRKSLKQQAHNRLVVDELYLLREYRSGKTCSQIAEAIGIHSTIVHRRLRELGVNRSNSQAHMGLQALENNPNWKGGKSNARGYVVVSVGKGKQVLEHRMVVEKVIGRKLLDNEIVHHKNGKKDDNSLDNLEVMTDVEHGIHHRGWFMPEPGNIFRKVNKNGAPASRIVLCADANSVTYTDQSGLTKTCTRCTFREWCGGLAAINAVEQEQGK